MLSFVAPDQGGFRANVLVTQERTDAVDASAFAEKQHIELSVGLPQYTRLRLDKTTIGTTPAAIAELTFQADGGPKIRQRVAYSVRDGVGYNVAFTCDDRGFDAVRSQFDTVLASLKIG